MARAYLISSEFLAKLKRMLRWYETERRQDRSSGSRPTLRPNFPILGRADGAISDDDTGTFSVYSGDPGSESDTTINIDAFTKKAVATNEFVLLFQTGSGWYAVKFASGLSFCPTQLFSADEIVQDDISLDDLSLNIRAIKDSSGTILGWCLFAGPWKNCPPCPPTDDSSSSSSSGGG